MKSAVGRINPNSGTSLSQEDRYFLRESFALKPALNATIAMPSGDSYATAGANAANLANPNFEVLGTDALSGNSTLTFSTGGGIAVLTNDSASGDAMIILPHLDSDQSPWAVTDWGTDDEVSFGALVTTGASVADSIIWTGLKLTNTSTVATDDDQAFFRYESGVNGGRLQAIVSNDGTDYTYDLGVEVTAATRYKLEVVIDSLRFPHFYVNGVEKKVGPALATAHDLIPYVGISTKATAGKTLHIHNEWISKVPNL